MNLVKKLPKVVFMLMSCLSLSSCDSLKEFIGPDNPIGMFIFAIIMLVFWGYVAILLFSAVGAIVGFVVYLVLGFFLPFNYYDN